MSRLSRHLLNFTLLVIAVSGRFELQDFFQLLAAGRRFGQVIHIFATIVRSLGYYILINAVYNVRNLGSPVRALITVVLWVAAGRSCGICDEVYNDYLSAPSNNILGRLAYIILSEKYQKVVSVFIAVYSWKITRLLAQWSFFSYFFKAHEDYEGLKSKRDSCTVILPIADTEPQRVEECLTSCLLNGVKKFIIVTSGESFAATDKMIEKFRRWFQEAEILTLLPESAGKWNMIDEGVNFVQTEIVVLVDTNVFWPHRFLDRLLVSFDDNVGFAMIYQRIRRFKLSLTEVSPPISSDHIQPEPRIGLSSGEHTARAIACRKDLLQSRPPSTPFGERLRESEIPYDEEREARSLERLALDNGYNALKGYAGHDAFEPPLGTDGDSAEWTHLSFKFIRYVRQSFRERFGDLVVTATRWRDLSRLAYVSHAAAFFILAFTFDCLMTAFITGIQRPSDWKFSVFGVRMAQSKLETRQYNYALERLQRYHSVFVWCHELLKVYAGMYLLLNLLAENAMSIDNQSPMTVLGNGDNGDARSPSPTPGSGTWRDHPRSPSTQSVETMQSTALVAWPSPRGEHDESTVRDFAGRTTPTASRTIDPIQRVIESSSHRPTSRPLSPPMRSQPENLERSAITQTPANQPSQSQSPTQTRREPSQSRPITPSERSHLREELSQAPPQDPMPSSPPSIHEQRPFSRSPSPRTKIPYAQPTTTFESTSNTGDAPRSPERRKRATRKQASYDEEFYPSDSDLSSIESSSAHGSRAGSVASPQIKFRTPNFSPSQPVSRSGTPAPALGSTPALPMPRQSPGPQPIPVKAEPVRQMAPLGGQTTAEPAPQLRVPKFTKAEPSPEAGPSMSTSPAKKKAKRAAPKAVAASQRKARCQQCGRLHAGECIGKS